MADDAFLQVVNPYFAVKRLHDRTGDMFKREVATLKRLSGQHHPHLMSLQLTYQWQDHYHLLFQWADGNLVQYWERYPQPEDVPRTPEYAKWVVQQLIGLTDGLKLIHECPPDENSAENDEVDQYHYQRTRGRHGDLKPENILWFRQVQSSQRNDQDPLVPHQGNFMISDFGCTSFHRNETGLVLPNTVPMSPTYRPPEYDLGDEINQSFDMWTWGCILLEFSVWYLGGYEAWDSFSKERLGEHQLLPGSKVEEDVYFQVEMRRISNFDEPVWIAILKESVVKVRKG